MQIFIRLHKDHSCLWLISISLFQQGTYEESQEEYEESDRITHQSYTSPRTYILIVNVVHHIKDAENTCKEKHGKTKNQVPGI